MQDELFSQMQLEVLRMLGGSFLQTMVQQEMQRRNAESGDVPNGQVDADAPQEPPRYVPRRR